MANLNSENPFVGHMFQEFMHTILKEKYDIVIKLAAKAPTALPVGTVSCPDVYSYRNTHSHSNPGGKDYVLWKEHLCVPARRLS